jgi:Acetyltransferase (GNAT) domain
LQNVSGPPGTFDGIDHHNNGVNRDLPEQQWEQLPIWSSAASKNIAFEPLENVRDQWHALTRASAHATLYHSGPWIESLHLTYGFPFRALLVERQGVVEAGVLFAQVRRPLARWWVALPFSDTCPPLSLDAEADAHLLVRLPKHFDNDRFEIRGMAAPAKWESADHFLSWELDISDSSPALYRSLETNFRRNLAKARKCSIAVEHGNSPEILDRFYRLHQRSRWRFGLPCQPARFFHILRQRFGDGVDVWLASHHSHDLAAVFLLAHGDTLHYKWSARHANETSGAGHLLTWSLVEHWAGRFQRLDLGRSDIRNLGLNRFKHGLGGRPSALPYAFFPSAPTNPSSSEVLSTKRRVMTGIWRLLPPPLCRGIERFAYRYLS